MKTFKQFASEAGIVKTIDGMKNLTPNEVDQSLNIIKRSSRGKERDKRFNTFLKQIDY